VDVFSGKYSVFPPQEKGKVAVPPYYTHARPARFLKVAVKQCATGFLHSVQTLKSLSQGKT
jgi:hypothetical protein